MSINSTTKLCCIIGDPVEYSPSPVTHNAAYQALGIDDQFVFVACKVLPKNLKSVVKAARAMSIRGLCCTMPHKEKIVPLLDKLDPVAHQIGAVNTVVNDNGVLTGYNTDWLGIVEPLEQITALKDKQVAVIGTGGAARATVFGLKQQGAQVVVYSRQLLKAKKIAREFEVEARDMKQLTQVKNADIIINATPVGMGELSDQTPVPQDLITSKHIVFDVINKPFETRLIKEAQQQGAKIIHGLEMFLHQGMAQFKLFTGQTAPEEVMRQTILKFIKT